MAVVGLAENPRNAQVTKLKGASDMYRLRIGDYRAIFRLAEATKSVTIVAVGDRKEIYE